MTEWKLPYAENIGHYWKTGISSPDTWIDKAKRLITEMGGQIEAEAFGASDGQAAFMFVFAIQGQRYKVVWPVLPTQYSTSKDIDARRQAATLLYHDIKAKVMTASVLGARVAFFSYLQLPDGRTAAEVATPELSTHFPLLLRTGASQ